MLEERQLDYSQLRAELRKLVSLEPNTPQLKALCLATLILIPIAITIWIVGLIIRWQKRVDWYWRWEAGKFFRINVYLFIPVGCSLFSALWFCLPLAFYKIDGSMRTDYFPYFETYNGLVNFPILITGILAAHNAALSAPAADFAGRACVAGGGTQQTSRRANRFPYNLNPKVFQWTLLIAVSTGLIPLFVTSAYAGIHRERLLDYYIELDDLLAVAEAGGSIDLLKVAPLETALIHEGHQVLRFGEAVALIHVIYCTVLLIPYALSIWRLFNILISQWRHLKSALARLEARQPTDVPNSTPVATSPKISFNSSSVVGSSESSSSYPPTVPSPPNSKRPQTMEDVESRMRPILETFSPNVTSFSGDVISAWGGNKVWADQEKEVRYRMYALKRVFSGFWILHLLSLITIMSFLMLAAWLAYEFHSDTFSPHTQRAISVGIVLAGFIVPEIIAGIHTIFDTWIILPIIHASPNIRPLSRQTVLPHPDDDGESDMSSAFGKDPSPHSPPTQHWFRRDRSQDRDRIEVGNSAYGPAVKISLETSNSKEKGEPEQQPKQAPTKPRPSQWKGENRYSEDGLQ